MSKVIVIPVATYEPQNNFYGYRISGKSINWMSCREQFHSGLGKKSLFFYSTGDPQQVKDFIAHAERLLGLGKRLRCKFLTTSNPRVLAIDSGKFWGDRRRKMLLTILLRASRGYRFDHRLPSDKQDAIFWATCRNDYLLNGTQRAVEKFFAGNTTVKPSAKRFLGWYVEMQNGSFLSSGMSLQQSTADKKRLAMKKYRNL